MTLGDLKARLDSFSPAQIEFVSRVVESLSNPLRADIREQGTWLTEAGAWIEYFGLALSVHHSATEEPLGLTAFESVFRNACRQVGWAVDPPGSRTRRFVDLTVRGGASAPRRLSLKSTAAAKMAESKTLITKLTEAAWIQDQRTARSYATTVPRVPRSRVRDHPAPGVPHRSRSDALPLPVAGNPGQHLRFGSTSADVPISG